MHAVTDCCFPASIPPGRVSHPSPGSGLHPFRKCSPLYLLLQAKCINSLPKTHHSRSAESWCLQTFPNIPCLTVLYQQHCSQEMNSVCFGLHCSCPCFLKSVSDLVEKPNLASSVATLGTAGDLI